VNLDLDLAVKAFGLAVPLGGIIYTWFATRQKDVDEAIKTVGSRLDTGSKRMDQHDLEIQSLQQTVASLPAKEDMHRLELTMSDIGGEIKAIGAHIGAQRDVMRRQETVVARIEEYMLEGGKGK
jgi:division protein CdvB (Snf7/Vps24/ESCRT-III family)